MILMKAYVMLHTIYRQIYPFYYSFMSIYAVEETYSLTPPPPPPPKQLCKNFTIFLLKTVLMCMSQYLSLMAQKSVTMPVCDSFDRTA